jgi:hypothetical protein
MKQWWHRPTIHQIAVALTREWWASGSSCITQEWQLLKLWIPLLDKLTSRNYFVKVSHSGDARTTCRKVQHIEHKDWLCSLLTLWVNSGQGVSINGIGDFWFDMRLVPGMLQGWLGGAHEMLLSTHKLCWSSCPQLPGRSMWPTVS